MISQTVFPPDIRLEKEIKSVTTRHNKFLKELGLPELPK